MEDLASSIGRPRSKNRDVLCARSTWCRRQMGRTAVGARDLHEEFIEIAVRSIDEPIRTHKIALKARPGEKSQHLLTPQSVG